jgi:hypothetical protein
MLQIDGGIGAFEMALEDVRQWISQRNTSPMAIGQRLPMSFAIVNNLLAPITRAINLRLSPQATVVAT